MIMSGYKTIVCEVCGSTALVTSRRQVPYCNNPSCEKEAKKRHRYETQRKYAEKIKALTMKGKAQEKQTTEEQEPIEQKEEVKEIGRAHV